MILVLIIALVLVASLVVTLNTSRANINFSEQFTSSSQATLASQAGIDALIQKVRNSADYQSFPCAYSGKLTLPGAASTYTVTAKYYPVQSTTADTCESAKSGGPAGVSTILGPQTGLEPATATVFSTGKASHGSQTIMEANLLIGPTSSLSKALSYALFSSNQLSLQQSGTLNELPGSCPSQPGGECPPNLFSRGQLVCSQSTNSAGSAVSYVNGSTTLSNKCSFAGDVDVLGTLTMINSANVSGNVETFGGDILLGAQGDPGGTPTIGKNATATGGCPTGTPTVGNVTVADTGAQISGNADAYLSITTKKAKNILGSSTQNDASLKCVPLPSALANISFPSLNPSPADWAGAGYTVIEAGGAGEPSCSSFFSGTAADQFLAGIQSATSKTVFYAPTCDVSYSQTTFAFNSNVALVVRSFQLSQQNHFESTSTTTHNFALLASPGGQCSPSTGVSPFPDAINVSNNSNLLSSTPATNASMNIFMYSMGSISYANLQGMNGLIWACGGFTANNSFTLNFIPDPAIDLPWVPDSSQPPTATVQKKFFLHG